MIDPMLLLSALPFSRSRPVAGRSKLVLDRREQRS